MDLFLLSKAATDRADIRDAYEAIKANKPGAQAALERLLEVSKDEEDDAMREVTEWDEEERKQEAEASRARARAKEIAYVGISARVKGANERAAAMKATAARAATRKAREATAAAAAEDEEEQAEEIDNAVSMGWLTPKEAEMAKARAAARARAVRAEVMEAAAAMRARTKARVPAVKVGTEAMRLVEEARAAEEARTAKRAAAARAAAAREMARVESSSEFVPPADDIPATHISPTPWLPEHLRIIPQNNRHTSGGNKKTKFNKKYKKYKKNKSYKKNTIKKVNKKTKRGKYSKKQIKTKRFRRKGMIRKMNNISRKNKPMWITEAAGGATSRNSQRTVAPVSIVHSSIVNPTHKGRPLPPLKLEPKEKRQVERVNARPTLMAENKMLSQRLSDLQKEEAASNKPISFMPRVMNRFISRSNMLLTDKEIEERIDAKIKIIIPMSTGHEWYLPWVQNEMKMMFYNKMANNPRMSVNTAMENVANKMRALLQTRQGLK